MFKGLCSSLLCYLATLDFYHYFSLPLRATWRRSDGALIARRCCCRRWSARRTGWEFRCGTRRRRTRGRTQPCTQSPLAGGWTELLQKCNVESIVLPHPAHALAAFFKAICKSATQHSLGKYHISSDQRWRGLKRIEEGYNDFDSTEQRDFLESTRAYLMQMHLV